MKRLILAGCLVIVTFAPAATQSGVTGRWRAVLLTPDGGTQNIALELNAAGEAVTGNLEGLAIREGRLDGSTLTLKIAGPNNQEISLIGQVSGDEIVFKSTGLPPGPIQFVARRDTRGAIAGSVSDPSVVQALMKQFNVPGVSIAVIKDFKIEWARGYGVADVETGAPVTADTMFQAASISKPVAAMASMKAVQDGRFTLDQDVNTILKSWKLPGGELHEGAAGHAAQPDEPHVRHRRRLRVSRLRAAARRCRRLPQILDGAAAVESRRQVRLERPPLTGFKYSGGARDDSAARADRTRSAGRSLSIARDWVLEPIGMTNSTYEQPLPAAREKQAARAHSRTGARMGDPWHVYPEHAAAGLVDDADRPREVRDRSPDSRWRSAEVESRALAARSMLEMVTPVGVGPFAVGFQVAKEGEGWYFAHGGSNWGFQCDMIAHRVKGYGAGDHDQRRQRRRVDRQDCAG